ncbi:putative 2-aminoethylphosphonate ABC transporter substrate-binding protein, partial [Klebsiella quasipneumoniae]|nr:putative 2-aminoethylphosphonate ABC transporter substrate-binding protein [Klebsiella quasipneumoniae]
SQTELPRDYAQRLIKNDFIWAAEKRDTILTEWRKRYDGKSAK